MGGGGVGLWMVRKVREKGGIGVGKRERHFLGVVICRGRGS